MVPMKRPQPHSSMYPTRLGLPKARRSRSTQSIESDMADVEGEALPNTTASGPDSAAIAVSRDAIVASASSQVRRSQPGSAAPFGAVRRSGYSSRSGCATISGAALPLTQIACPVGWPGNGPSATERPSSTVAVAPHRDTHSGQNVATSVANLHPQSHPADSPGPQPHRRTNAHHWGNTGRKPVQKLPSAYSWPSAVLPVCSLLVTSAAAREPAAARFPSPCPPPSITAQPAIPSSCPHVP